ncbi:hypothetical protein PN499_15715 [Kamptonema animale CS-326]|jgi:hypothetical protein|uniref:hypothetical protein n=1 Tax=Kamptonema animale TaxID=92934 RepID=UPI00232B62A0|nr:hypothetical protein [Kamptonema animale]MDB9512635.1 hypothetical protein [Kamptonema animale CS-326]
MASLFSQKPGLFKLNRLRGVLAGLFLTLGLGAIATYLTSTSVSGLGLLAVASPKVTALLRPPVKFCPKPFTIDSEPEPINALIADGIYFYGQSPQRDQVEKEYFVFELRKGKVIGAFYLPRSAFYCFYGSLQSTQLDVKVVDSFDGSTSPYSVNLPQYHRLSNISENDRRLLNICKKTYQRQVWGQ